nr:hypothetical protein [Tanacetum cinerariifolium]
MCHGKDHSVGVLPQLREDGLLENKPMAILERRLGKVNNKPFMFVLIQWTNKPVEEATWKIYGDLITRMSNLDDSLMASSFDPDFVEECLEACSHGGIIAVVMGK